MWWGKSLLLFASQGNGDRETTFCEGHSCCQANGGVIFLAVRHVSPEHGRVLHARSKGLVDQWACLVRTTRGIINIVDNQRNSYLTGVLSFLRRFRSQCSGTYHVRGDSRVGIVIFRWVACFSFDNSDGGGHQKIWHFLLPRDDGPPTSHQTFATLLRICHIIGQRQIFYCLGQTGLLVKLYQRKYNAIFIHQYCNSNG